jgi:hypothetical protein
MTATGGPSGHDGDHDLGHEPDEALGVEDVQPTCFSSVSGRLLLSLIDISGRATDALIPA